MQSTKKEIEYCSKVIERAPYISDSSILAKAYLGRGYGYEIIEKFNEAKRGYDKSQGALTFQLRSLKSSH